MEQSGEEMELHARWTQKSPLTASQYRIEHCGSFGSLRSAEWRHSTAAYFANALPAFHWLMQSPINWCPIALSDQYKWTIVSHCRGITFPLLASSAMKKVKWSALVDLQLYEGIDWWVTAASDGCATDYCRAVPQIVLNLFSVCVHMCSRLLINC